MISCYDQTLMMDPELVYCDLVGLIDTVSNFCVICGCCVICQEIHTVRTVGSFSPLFDAINYI
jgi:hypothetical protein